MPPAQPLDRATAVWLERNPRGLAVLGALLTAPDRLANVAARLDLPLNTVWRLALRLEALGLLRVARVEARTGRALRWYVATATRFLIPYEAEGDRLPADVVRRVVERRVEAQARGLIAAAERTQRTTGARQWGTLVYADRHGSLVVRPDFASGRTPDLLAAGAPAYLNFYSDDLRLTRDRAKALQRELVELVRRYKALPGDGSYSLSVVLAPRVPG